VKDPLAWLLNAIYVQLQGFPVIVTIGAYGVAIILVTIIIRLVLAPLQQFQLVRQRKTMADQRKLAPQVAELRKKYKKDPQKLNAETMKLYQEHGVNPLSGLIGCLPLVVQLPVLTALYYVFRQANVGSPHFLFVPNLMALPNSTHFLGLAIPIPAIAYLVFPLLAAGTTFIQSKMLQQPPPVNPTDQELQMQQTQRMMVYFSPLMIGFFSLSVPAGLSLYWFVGNCVSIIQQSFVVGWGNLRPGGGGAKAVLSPPKNAGPPQGPPRQGDRLKGPANGGAQGRKPKKRPT
jgi:YidC/Oxa1 family membrane protein insertase